MNLPTNQQPPGDGRRREQGVALVIVLSFVVLLTVAVVAYFSRTLSNRQVASNSLMASRTEQLARGALDQIVSDFKQEIANGSKATGVSGTNTYYPISSDGTTLLRTNMLPQRSGNPAAASGQPDPIPNLVRISNHSDPTTTPTLTAPMVSSRASNAVSTTPSLNGRVVSLPRWNLHYLIPQKDPSGTKPDPATSFVAPDWVMMTQEEGPAVLTSPTRDSKGNAVTVTGRYAYAVYDEGGLLDANVVGFPSGAAPTQIGYKSSLGMSDLSVALANATPSVLLSPAAVDKLVGWRSYASAQPNNTFPNNNFASNLAVASNLNDPTDPSVRYFNSLQTNSSGFTRTSNSVWNNRTDQAFLGRQQLIAFQQSFGPGTFPTPALQLLGTFSRELNAPSWGPSYDASEVGGSAGYPYRTVRDSNGVSNRFLPGVRFKNAGSILSYRTDGTFFQYTVKAGDPLVQRRFPLSRLAWIGPNGPRADRGGTAANIQACFGLVWGLSTDQGLVTTNGPMNVWRYVGSTGNTPQGAIKTLYAVSQETLPREPNFFELLQSGMLTGSLAQDINPPGNDSSYAWYTTPQSWTELQVFRIGASIITQNRVADSTFSVNYPMFIEYARSGIAVEAVGVDDLPYINMMSVIGGKNQTDGSAASCNLYAVFGLWNPHQRVASVPASTRPAVRLCVAGQGVVFNEYGQGIYGNVPNPSQGGSYPGFMVNFSTSPTTGIQTLPLSAGANLGVNGFIDPHVPLAGDVNTVLNGGTPAGYGWAVLNDTINGASYVGYRLPDFNYDPVLVAPYPTSDTWWASMQFNVFKGANTFNCWMEFQDPNGKWIPYNYFAGIEHVAPGYNKSPGFYAMNMGNAFTGPNSARVGDKADPYPLDPLSTPQFTFHYRHGLFFNSDPTTLRSTQCFSQSPDSRPENSHFMRTSIWSSATEVVYPSFPDSGRIGTQSTAALFAGGNSVFGPAGLGRNNTTAPVTVVTSGGDPQPAAYRDPDGVQRISDSGLYPSSAPPSAATFWQGDPYALSTDRIADRPLILHRTLANVGELGYVSRDHPFRTLDFFTAKSADSGLLDLFTASQNSEAIGAGRINLNTRNAPALAAALSGTITDTAPNSPTVLSIPNVIATKLAAFTTQTAASAGPLICKDEIATRFLPTLSAGLPFTTSGADFRTANEQNVKTQREAVTRAFAEVGQTRTWVLLIDIVAQSGRYAPNAGSLDRFSVESERHYWLHVAIDRFTGQVIDQQLEAVSE